MFDLDRFVVFLALATKFLSCPMGKKSFKSFKNLSKSKTLIIRVHPCISVVLFLFVRFGSICGISCFGKRSTFQCVRSLAARRLNLLNQLPSPPPFRVALPRGTGEKRSGGGYKTIEGLGVGYLRVRSHDWVLNHEVEL